MKLQKTKIWADINGEEAVVRFLPSSLREMSEVNKVVEELEDVGYNHKIKVLVINFDRLKNMTSSFLGKLIALNKSMSQIGVALRVCGMSSEVQSAFKICRLDKLIPTFDNEEKALKG